MDEGTPAVYGLRFQGRALAALKGDKEKSRYLVGTQSLRDENEVDLVEFHEDRNEVTCEGIFAHPHEIWELTPCDARPDLFFSSYNTVESGFQASLWKMPWPLTDEGEESPPLEKLIDLGEPTENMKRVLWRGEGSISHVVSLHGKTVNVWDLEYAALDSQAVSALTTTSKETFSRNISAAAWDPHSQNIATACDTQIQFWDTRSMKSSFTIDRAHGDCVRDIDYNPNRLHYLASSGDDCKIRFWDVRKPDKALKEFGEHSHWVWQVKYNGSHDQLVLSSSTDASVRLWSVPSVSSVPLESYDDTTPKDLSQKDGLIKCYEEHEESVYCIVWSPNDVWSFASLSFDGHLAVNRVPQEAKYKILL